MFKKFKKKGAGQDQPSVGIPDHPSSQNGTPTAQVGNSDSQGSTGSKNVWSLERVLFYAFVLLMPVFFLPVTLSPVALNKQLLAGVLMFGMFIYMASMFLAKGRLRFPKTKALWAVLALFGAVLLSTLLSQVKSISTLGTSPDSLFWVSIYSLVFLLGVMVLRGKKTVTLAATAYVAGGGLLGLFLLLQLSGVNLFPFDFAQNTSFNTVGAVFAAGFVVAATLSSLLAFLVVANVKNKKVKAALWALAGVLALLVLQLNFTPLWLTIAVTFAVVAFVAGLEVMKTKEMNLRPMLVPFFVIIIALLAVVVQPNVPSFINAPAEVSPNLSSTANVAQETLSGSRIANGTGPGTFAYNYAQHRSAEVNRTSFWAVQFNQGQNAFLTYASTWGLLGVLALLAVVGTFVVTMLKALMRANKEVQEGSLMHAIAVGALASTVFLGTALFTYRGNAVMHSMFFASAAIGMSALMASGALGAVKLNLLKEPKKMLSASLVVIVLISAGLGGIYFLGQKYIAHAQLQGAVNTFSETQDIDATLNKLDAALQNGSNDEQILRVSTQALLLKLQQIVNNEELSQQEASTQFSNALTTMLQVSRRATVVNPKNVTNWVQLGQAWRQVVGIQEGAENSALDAFSNARKVDPLNPSLPLEEARVYVTMADVNQARLNQLNQQGGGDVNAQQELVDARKQALDSAVEKLEESVALKNNYSDARVLLAAVYQRLGNLDKAIEQTQAVAALNPNDPNVTFQLGLYQYQNQNYTAAQGSFERAIVLARDAFANARFYLGLTHNQLGQTELAIAQFERIASDNPDNELVRAILDNLINGRDIFDGLQQPQQQPPIPDTGGAEEPVIP